MQEALGQPLLESLAPILLHSSLPGAFGGLACFLLGLKRGHYRNNKYVAKVTLEILGGTIVASFVAFSPNPLLGFAVGLSWASILQIVRVKITQVVRASLEKRIDQGGGSDAD